MKVKLKLAEKCNKEFEDFIESWILEGIKDDYLGAMVLAKLEKVVDFENLSDSAYYLLENKKIKMDLSFYEKCCGKDETGFNFSIETKMFLINIAADNSEVNREECHFNEYAIVEYHLDNFVKNNDKFIKELEKSKIFLGTDNEERPSYYVINMKKVHEVALKLNFKGCDSL